MINQLTSRARDDAHRRRWWPVVVEALGSPSMSIVVALLLWLLAASIA